MTPEEREAFYDREIAPLLLELANKCQANDMSLVASVEWEPGKAGRTMSVRDTAGIALNMVRWAAEAQGNADSLILRMKKHGEEYGHNSMCLHMLGAKYDEKMHPRSDQPV